VDPVSLPVLRDVLDGRLDRNWSCGSLLAAIQRLPTAGGRRIQRSPRCWSRRQSARAAIIEQPVKVQDNGPFDHASGRASSATHTTEGSTTRIGVRPCARRTSTFHSTTPTPPSRTFSWRSRRRCAPYENMECQLYAEDGRAAQRMAELVSATLRKTLRVSDTRSWLRDSRTCARPPACSSSWGRARGPPRLFISSAGPPAARSFHAILPRGGQDVPLLRICPGRGESPSRGLAPRA
jgi:hypothetical protein